MPVTSQAQRRWAFATAEGKTDAPRSVGRDFLAASHGMKGLPEHAPPHPKRTMAQMVGQHLAPRT